MLHILLFLLKIIGIVLVSLLGLLLFIVCLVLFIPIRYKLDVTVKGVIKGEAKVTWLLRAISFRATYAEEQLRMKLRIFGRIFYDNQEPGRGKEKKKRKKTSENGQRRQKDEKKRRAEPVLNENEDQTKELVEKQKTAGSNEQNHLPDSGSDAEIEEKPDIRDKEEEQYSNFDTQTKEWTTLPSNEEKIEAEKTKLGFFERIYRKISSKINEVIKKIKEILKSIRDGIFQIREKWSKIKEFYYDEKNHAGILSTLQSLKKILKHLRPKRLDVEFEFGTGDPCSTGQIIGLMAVFYGYYGNSVKVIPNFEDAIYEGSVFCYGRIRLFTLLIICIKLKLDNNFNQLIKNFKRLKEDL